LSIVKKRLRALRALLCLCSFLSLHVLVNSGYAATQEATNGFLTIVTEDNASLRGVFTVKTGASHPFPNRNIFYSTIGTSYITLRDATSQEMWINQSVGGIVQNAGSSGYTLRSMFDYPSIITPLGSSGFRTTYSLPNFTVEQDVEVVGLILNNSFVQHKVTITNATGSARDIGTRFLWDFMVDLIDASYFRTRDPDTSFTNSFTDFPSPTFPRYEVTDDAVIPTFSIFGSVAGGSLLIPPTAPEELRYASWGLASVSAWSFSNTGQAADSAMVYFWGLNAPWSILPGESLSFTQYVTTGTIDALKRSVPVLNKSVTPQGTICTAELLTYTISFSNSGDATSYDLTITDTIPAGLRYQASSLQVFAQPDAQGTPTLKSIAWSTVFSEPISWINGDPPNWQETPLMIRWVMNRLVPSNSGFISFRMRAPVEFSGGSLLLVNSASATNALDSALFESNQVTIDRRGFGMNKFLDTGGESRLCGGEPVTMRINYSNNCTTATAWSATIEDTVDGIAYVSCTGGASCWFDGTKVIWDMPTIAPGEVGLVTYQAVWVGPGSGGAAQLKYLTSLGESASIYSNSLDAKYPGDGVTFRKTVAEDPVRPGDFFNYTITVQNDSCVTINDLVIWDTLPAGVTLIDPKGGTPLDGDTWVHWDVIPSMWPALGPGDSFGVEMTVQVTSACDDIGPNTAIMNTTAMVVSNWFTTPGPFPPPISAAPMMVSLMGPSLQVSRKPNTMTPPVNSLLTYELKIRNTGSDTAFSVAIWDTPPSGLVFAGCAGGTTCWWDGNHVDWYLDPIGPRNSASDTATVYVSWTVIQTTGNVGPNVGWASYTNAISCEFPLAQSPPLTVIIGQQGVDIFHSVSPNPVATGSQVTYTIALTSLGADTAQNIAVWDTLPGDVDYISCAGGTTCFFDGSMVSWSVAPLPPGAVTNISFTVTVTSLGPTTGPSVANMFHTNTADLNFTLVSSNTAMVVVAQATLDIDKTVNQNPAAEGSLLTYRLEVTNSGGNTARMITVWDTLPAGALYINCNGGTTCWYDGSQVFWRLPDMPGGDVQLLQATVTPTGALTGANVAMADYTNSDLVWQPTSISNAVTVTVVNPSLAIQKSSNKPAYASQEPVIFTIGYTNTGTGQAEKIFLWDTVPAGWIVFSSTPTAGQVGDMLVWSGGTLNPGKSAVVTYSLIPPPGGCDPLAATNSVSMHYENSAFIAQSARVSTAPAILITSVALVMTLTPSGWVIPQGAPLRYTIEYENQCSDTAWNIFVWDTLPAGVSFLSCEATPGGSCGLDATGSRVEWNLPLISPGTTGAIFFTVFVAGAGPSIGPTKALSEFFDSAAVRYAVASNPVSVSVVTPLLEIAKHVPSEAMTQEPFAFTLTVTNTGTSTAYNIQIVDTLPPELRFVSATGSPTVTGNVVVWNVTELGIGEAYQTTVNVSSPLESSHAVLTNVAEVMYWTRSYGGVLRPAATDDATVILIHDALVLRVFPNPYRPASAVRGTMKFTGLPDGAEVRIFTLSGSEIIRLSGLVNHRLEWDGRNEQGSPVAEGIYFYVVEIPDAKEGKKYVKGKFGLIR